MVNNSKTYLEEVDSKRHEINWPLVQMIKYALVGLSMNYKRKRGRDGVSYKYLLNQSIRQYVIPKTNFHVSKRAAELWTKLGMSMDESNEAYILYYEYRDSFAPLYDVSDVQTYSGSKKKNLRGISVKSGESRSFNTLFIDEHTTPVSDVIAALKLKFVGKSSDEIELSDIIELLDKIHITKMLREENCVIKLNSTRIKPEEYNNNESEVVLDIIKNKCVDYPELIF